MKNEDEKKYARVEKLEAQGDRLLEKESFDACLSAIDSYLNAQETLYKLANDDTIPQAKPYPAFNTSNVSLKAWYLKLGNKVDKASKMMADPRVVKK